MGAIIRTAGESMSLKEIKRELQFTDKTMERDYIKNDKIQCPMFNS